MPVFWLGLMLAYAFAVLLKDTPFWLPPSGRMTSGMYLPPLYETWNLPIFASISRSEEQHIEALEGFAERYDLAVPASDAAGVFENEEMQVLHDRLVEQGSASLAAALHVGATIEDLDISDLLHQIDESDNDDLRILYQNLMKGSRNHLRSFVSQLERLDETYTAQYIDQPYLERTLQIVRENAPISDPNYEL